MATECKRCGSKSLRISIRKRRNIEPPGPTFIWDQFLCLDCHKRWEVRRDVVLTPEGGLLFSETESS